MGKLTNIYGGPFDTEREFNDWILDDLMPGLPAPLEYRAKRALVDGHEIVFTHADFSARNILVDENCRVIAVLDWESSGWYPEWWEYFTAYMDGSRCKGWDTYLCYTLPLRFDREIIGMSYVSRYCGS